MIKFQRTGYYSKDLTTDIILGITDGLDMSLWCYVYASIIFVGVLSIYLTVGILAALMGWVLVSLWVTLTSREPLHMANLDDQAVVIFGSIAVLACSSAWNWYATTRPSNRQRKRLRLSSTECANWECWWASRAPAPTY